MTTRDVSAEDIGQAYFGLYHQLHRLVDGSMAAAGLSLARTKVLARLADGGPMNQVQLAGLLGFAPRSVTDTVDALERDGLVCRTDCATDRRARIVSITPAGQDALDAAQIVRLKALDEIFGSLSASERTHLVALLTTIRTNLPSGDLSHGR